MSSTTLSPIQEQVIAFIAAGLSIRKTADEAKIHRNTIANWRRTNPAFAHALAHAQYDRVLFWRDQAEEHAARAIDTIAEILTDRDASSATRLRAALAILKQATTLPPDPPPVTVEEEIPAPIHVHAPAPSSEIVQPEKRTKLHKVAQPPAPQTPPTSPQKKPHRTTAARAAS